MVAIFVLTAFLFIISVDLIVLEFQGKSHPAFEPTFAEIDSAIFDGKDLSIPADTFFSKGHTWLRKNEEGMVHVGVDSFGATALGPLTILKCAEAGKEVKRGEMIFEGGYGDKIIKFLSPVNGFVRSVNSDIIGKKLSSPYETWGVEVYPRDTRLNGESFLSGSEALNRLKGEYIRLKSFIEDHSPEVELAGVTMYDGGTVSDDASSPLTEQSAADFEKEFLSL